MTTVQKHFKNPRKICEFSFFLKKKNFCWHFLGLGKEKLQRFSLLFLLEHFVCPSQSLSSLMRIIIIVITHIQRIFLRNDRLCRVRVGLHDIFLNPDLTGIIDVGFNFRNYTKYVFNNFMTLKVLRTFNCKKIENSNHSHFTTFYFWNDEIINVGFELMLRLKFFSEITLNNRRKFCCCRGCFFVLSKNLLKFLPDSLLQRQIYSYALNIGNIFRFAFFSVLASSIWNFYNVPLKKY